MAGVVDHLDVIVLGRGVPHVNGGVVSRFHVTASKGRAREYLGHAESERVAASLAGRVTSGRVFEAGPGGWVLRDDLSAGHAPSAS